MGQNTSNQMLVVSLPPEITLLITSYLPHFNLLSASLVCKTWRLAIIPRLFRSVILVTDSHIAQFSSAANLGGGSNSSLSILKHVQSFSIKSNLHSQSITESGIASLVPCVANLVQLKRLHWHLHFTPSNKRVLEAFQAQCPQLGSVELLISGGNKSQIELGESQYTNLFNFKKLTHFQLVMRHVYIDTRSTGPLNMLISNCPGLESLQLYMERYTESYSLEKVTTWMTAGVTIQCLRKLHLWGNIEIDEASFVSPLDTERYHFKDFLARHPRIEELTLGCTALRGFYGATNPECLAQVLPSLKRFSGPDCLCDLLIRSSLAKQLEYLTIEDVGFRSGKCFGPSKEYNVLALAALQELDIGTEIFPRALIILNAILPVAPELKRLGLSPVPPRHHARFLEVIGLASNLQKTSIFNFMPSIMYPMDPLFTTPGRIAQEELFRKMIRICPNLEVTGPWVGSMVLEVAKITN